MEKLTEAAVEKLDDMAVFRRVCKQVLFAELAGIWFDQNDQVLNQRHYAAMRILNGTEQPGDKDVLYYPRDHASDGPESRVDEKVDVLVGCPTMPGIGGKLAEAREVAKAKAEVAAETPGEKVCRTCDFWMNDDVDGNLFGYCHLNPKARKLCGTSFCSHWTNTWKNE